MRFRTRIAVVVLGLAACGPVSSGPMGAADLVGSYTWSLPGLWFGGFSGLEVMDGGRSFVAVSDRGGIVRGSFERTDGAISGVDAEPSSKLRETDGAPLRKHFTDSEGLAIAPDGTLYVSFEGQHRVLQYSDIDSAATALPRHPDFDGMQSNSSLEALAIGADGALYTMPERSGRKERPFPVYRFKDGKWTQPFSVPRRGEYLAVGADFGPDGRFYLLERYLTGIFGFRTRVRSFSIVGDAISDERLELETYTGVHDNLEGISVWQADDGSVHLTMISDDNFRPFQVTEFVEYRLQGGLDGRRAER